MKTLILSHFDSKIGPKVIKTVGDEILEDNLKEIIRYMDYHEEGYFIHEFNGISSANIIFFIPSPIARGNFEIAMISIVLIDDDTDPKSYYPLLNQFVSECKNINDAYRGFHSIKGESSLARECYDNIKDLMYRFFNFQMINFC